MLKLTLSIEKLIKCAPEKSTLKEAHNNVSRWLIVGRQAVSYLIEINVFHLNCDGLADHEGG